MQRACVPILCVCICVTVLLRSAISQPRTESDTYTVRLDEYLSLPLSFSSPTPFFFVSISFPHLSVHITGFVLKSWPPILSLFLLCTLSHCLIFFLFKVPHKSFLVGALQCSLLGLNLVLIPCFFRPLVFLSMQVTAAFFP